MTFFFRSSPFNRHVSRGISGGLLVLCFFLFTGIPLPQSVNKNPAERFPCENCPCGCSTADFCWDKCCCLDDEGKLQWARDNAVTPPQFLVSRVAIAARKTLAANTKKPACCCCKKKKPESSGTAENSCETPALTPPPAESNPDSKAAARSHFVIVDSAAKCRGAKLVWSLLSKVLVPEITPTHRTTPVLLYSIQIFHERACRLTFAPDPPVAWPVVA